MTSILLVVSKVIGLEARRPSQPGWLTSDLEKIVAKSSALARLRMMRTRGIHHITAIAGDPQQNLDFYTEVLGLRLVKRTVNFDDPGSYHFYFGDLPPLEHRPAACGPSAVSDPLKRNAREPVEKTQQRSETPPGAQAASLCSAANHAIGLRARPSHSKNQC
jgi:catechol 2,3-dioxygenase-like lactoylglutathione lyase family enzyme